MLLRNSRNQRAVFRTAMATLLGFFVLPLVAHPTTTYWIDIMDGVRGALLGAAIALIAVSGVLKRRNSGDASQAR